MNQPDLERFVSQVLALQARRKACSLPQAEAELLTQVASAVRIHTSASHLFTADCDRLVYLKFCHLTHMANANNDR